MKANFGLESCFLSLSAIQILYSEVRPENTCSATISYGSSCRLDFSFLLLMFHFCLYRRLTGR